MRRRTFIASVLGVGSSATAGCLGFTVRSEDDVQRREERAENLRSTAEAQRRTAEAQRKAAEAQRKTADARQETIDAQQQTISEQRTELENRQQRIDELNAEVDEKERRIEDLNATIDQKEQRISSLESGNDGKDQRISSLEADVEALEADVEALRREKVMVQYRLGYDYQDVASNDFSTGVDNREGDWTTSLAYFSRAEGRYLSASDAFDDALTTAQDLGFSSVTGRIEESMQAVEHYAEASNSYANAAYLYTEGQTSSAEDWDQQAANSFQAAEDMTIYGPDEIESNL